MAVTDTDGTNRHKCPAVVDAFLLNCANCEQKIERTTTHNKKNDRGKATKNNKSTTKGKIKPGKQQEKQSHTDFTVKKERNFRE